MDGPSDATGEKRRVGFTKLRRLSAEKDNWRESITRILGAVRFPGRGNLSMRLCSTVLYKVLCSW